MIQVLKNQRGKVVQNKSIELKNAIVEAKKQAKKNRKAVDFASIEENLNREEFFNKTKTKQMRDQLSRFVQMKSEQTFIDYANELNKLGNNVRATYIAKDILTSDFQKLGLDVVNHRVTKEQINEVYDFAIKQNIIHDAIKPRWERFIYDINDDLAMRKWILI
jgi:hypothetical protein